MGTWGVTPFDNDAAADFLEQVQTSPSRVVSKTLRDVARASPETYFDVDATSAAWAACELVALAYGQGEPRRYDDEVLDFASRLKPKEELRRLALQVLSRLADRSTSELAALWHEGNDGANFGSSLSNLRSRLEAASRGPRATAVPKKGDVIMVPVGPDSKQLIVLQVVASREVAVFEGQFGDEATALSAIQRKPAHRVPTSVSELMRHGQHLANVTLRKDLRGKKLYAGETGAIEGYILATASAGGVRMASYDEVRDCDVLSPYSEEELRMIATGEFAFARVRSPAARETELCVRSAAKWDEIRTTTTPGPFGDPANLRSLVAWIELYGVENAVKQFHYESIDRTGSGRPNEGAERRSYAFAGLVALWQKTLPSEEWPAVLAERIPSAPSAALMQIALPAARTLASRVITREAELRLIWDTGPDQGVEFRRQVALLQKALVDSSVP